MSRRDENRNSDRPGRRFVFTFVACSVLLLTLPCELLAGFPIVITPDDVVMGEDVTMACRVQLTKESFPNITSRNASEEINDMTQKIRILMYHLHTSKKPGPSPSTNGMDSLLAEADAQGQIRIGRGYDKDRVNVTSAKTDLDVSEMTLTLHDVTYSDTGEYQCWVLLDGVVDYRGNKARLSINGPPQISDDKLPSVIHHILNTRAVLVCPFTAHPRSTRATWTMPNGTVQRDKVYSSDNEPIQFEFRLVIKSLTNDRIGTYTCTVTNDLGSDHFSFEVSDAPFVEIRQAPNNILSVSTTEKLQSECIAGNMIYDQRFDQEEQPVKPSDLFTWTLETPEESGKLEEAKEEGIYILGQAKVEEGVRHLESVLTMPFPSFRLRGNLTCSMVYQRVTYNSTVFLRVEGPPEIEARPQLVHTMIGWSAMLICHVVSHPPALYAYWTNAAIARGDTILSEQSGHNGTAVELGSDFNMSLLINEVTYSHLGTYNCVATNDMGYTRRLVQLVLCSDGYQPSPDGVDCQDIDECAASPDQCEYLCSNLNGTYLCSCPGKQRLAANGRTCQAPNFEVEPKLALALGLGAASALVLVLLVVGCVCVYRIRRKKKHRDSVLKRIHEKAKETRSQQIIRFTNSDPNSGFTNRGFTADLAIGEFPRERLNILEVIGEGKFGQVCMAEALNIIGTGKWELVAVKMCKESATDTDKLDFLNELSLVSNIPRHLNVVNYLGCCTATEPVLLIMEMITGGDLQTYLRRTRDVILKPGYADLSALNGRGYASSEAEPIRHDFYAWSGLDKELMNGLVGNTENTDSSQKTGSRDNFIVDNSPDNDKRIENGHDISIIQSGQMMSHLHTESDSTDTFKTVDTFHQPDTSSRKTQGIAILNTHISPTHKHAKRYSSNRSDTISLLRMNSSSDDSTFGNSNEFTTKDQQAVAMSRNGLSGTHTKHDTPFEYNIETSMSQEHKSIPSIDKQNYSNDNSYNIKSNKDYTASSSLLSTPMNRLSPLEDMQNYKARNSTTHQHLHSSKAPADENESKRSIKSTANQKHHERQSERPNHATSHTHQDSGNIRTPETLLESEPHKKEDPSPQTRHLPAEQAERNASETISVHEFDANLKEETHSSRSSPVRSATLKPHRALTGTFSSHSSPSLSVSGQSLSSPRRLVSRPAHVTSDSVSLPTPSHHRSHPLSRHGSNLSHMTGSEISRLTGSDFSHVTVSEDIDNDVISSSDLFAFALQIARGMRHLAEHKIIHRDLAARNILITDKGICKITDFGLARTVDGTDNYERTSKGPLPIRWMSPESLIDGNHTTKSDVWAYGVLLWEIVTLGASPYPGLSAKDVFKFVNSGRKMERPLHCKLELYDLMCDCWSFLPVNRPNFDKLCYKLEELLEQEGDYINLDLFQSENYACLDTDIIDERL